MLLRFAPLAWTVRWHHRVSRRKGSLDFSRLWWTPPLSAHQAWELEKNRVETELGLTPVVSITDHDNLEAPMALRVLDEADTTPVSVEWTVPYRDTFFHLGVHNLPADEAQALFAAMESYTAEPRVANLGDLLSSLHRRRQVLIVLNHPLWDEKGLGGDRHRRRLEELLKRFGGTIHALEWNGFRSWRENSEVLALSQSLQFPLVAGGDRHGRQPSSVLSVSAAECFDEFVDDVRRRRQSSIVLMPGYREQLRLRVVESICEVLRDDPSHSLGWRRWSDRVFYRNDAGDAVPLSRIWQKTSIPFPIWHFVGLMSLLDAGLGHSQLRSAMRFALMQGEETT